jgi:hypothetical protein
MKKRDQRCDQKDIARFTFVRRFSKKKSVATKRFRAILILEPDDRIEN